MELTATKFQNDILKIILLIDCRRHHAQIFVNFLVCDKDDMRNF
jgi:hypothetical protein